MNKNIALLCLLLLGGSTSYAENFKLGFETHLLYTSPYEVWNDPPGTYSSSFGPSFSLNTSFRVGPGMGMNIGVAYAQYQYFDNNNWAFEDQIDPTNPNQPFGVANTEVIHRALDLPIFIYRDFKTEKVNFHIGPGLIPRLTLQDVYKAQDGSNRADYTQANLFSISLATRFAIETSVSDQLSLNFNIIPAFDLYPTGGFVDPRLFSLRTGVGLYYNFSNN
ncbi:outer membrane beta-barrel protein [bacterium]|nr:outer membrane beta-barrel protein [bacterium]